ncbi:MAG: hypothetical protein QOI38_261 [Sphingomonadales bacterium]|jgi:uncharacterized phage protein (TIGR02218 family)|nr:hypothetical protein [Sphingomonadales bacterium]
MSIVDRELATIGFCWRIERRDGVTIGLTGHDRDISRDGLLYRAAPGMLPSAVTLSDGFDADGLDIEGALASDAIGAPDLAAGRWDEAALSIFMIDWERPDQPTIAIASGVLGDVAMRGPGFEAELRGAAALLEREVVEQTSPACRAELGDKRCRVDMAGRVRIARVAAAIADTVIEIEGGAAGDAHRFGRLRWIGGRNSGLASPIAAVADGRITLFDAPHFPAAPGDLVEIAEGCDKSFATCSGRFANALNFRGEPHLPGMDLLTRYPGA